VAVSAGKTLPEGFHRSLLAFDRHLSNFVILVTDPNDPGSREHVRRGSVRRTAERKLTEGPPATLPG
jgi:hypothetical protein